MSDTFQELADIPKDFVKDGMLFMNRCTKRMYHRYSPIPVITRCSPFRHLPSADTRHQSADKREFIKISQAVGFGFLIMGVIGYFIKLIHIPVNNILVGGA
ncbi:protein translocase SEC61 complex gamma subunit, archaeal and eukaryotic [Blastomyces percursus]|uniref:Protein translocase SEC61 complex gamma subunit, archaeal and eukaryotic n=1 Tax=Blastomyces percursus TaxID=1658174 RepID=A0A1J9QFJ8_9EURO|nr:protein translocase SEC61 complex gamma subunit, archaeal and eukaryotic [Blastomyces percursus]